MSAKVPRPKRIKIEPNLYLVGESYYYRRGDFEESLGRFSNEKAAIEYKRIYEIKRDSVGALAYKFRMKDIWPDYEKERDPANSSQFPNRRALSEGSFVEMRYIYASHLRPFFGNKKLSEIDTPLWNQYKQRSKVADLTNHRKVLGTFLRWCVENNYLRSIPLMSVPKVRRRVRTILKPKEIEALLQHSHGNLLLFVSLYLFMGVRWSEIIKLEWSSIDLNRGVMIVQEGTTRTRRSRSVTINSFVLSLLVARRKEQVGNDVKSPWVFPKRGRPKEHASITGINNPWRVMLRKAGLTNVRQHDLRATFEYYAHKRTDFTDTQREKYAGAAIEVQRKHYVTFDADDVRGLEEVVVFPGIECVISEKLKGTLGGEPGKSRVGQNVSEANKRPETLGKRGLK